jgi:hypothetical protein
MRMVTMFVAAGVALAAGQARADEVAPAAEPPAPAETAPVEPPAPVAVVTAEPAPVATVTPAPAPPVATRPEGFSVGIGVGYSLPASLERPNTASVRMRLASGLSFEPFVALTNDAFERDGEFASEQSFTTAGIGANVRFPLASRGAYDLMLLGGATFDYLSEDGDNNSNDSTSSFAALSWGLGIDWWITSHWSVSASATNAIASYSTRTLTQLDGTTTTTTSTGLQASFAPRVSFLVHMYF